MLSKENDFLSSKELYSHGICEKFVFKITSSLVFENIALKV